MLRGDDDVARQRHFEAAAQGEAVHRGNGRFPDVGPVGQAAEPALDPIFGQAVFGRVLEVVAGREGFVAGAGQHDHPDVVVGQGVVPYPGQFLPGGRMDGVQAFRAVERDRGDVILLGEQRVFVSHESSLVGA